MKFGQLIEHNVRNVFLQKSCRKWVWETSLGLLSVFKKALYKVKASCCHLSFHIFWQISTWVYTKVNFITLQTVDPEIYWISLLVSLQRYTETSFPATFCVWFLKKNVSHVLLNDQISLPDCLYFLIALTCCPVCDVINFKINLSFLIKSFFYMTKFRTKMWIS